MGDMAEMYDYYDPFDDEDDEREDYYITNKIWPASTGEIRVSEMSDEHLRNAIRYLEKSTNDSPLLSMLLDEEKEREQKQ